MDWKCPTCAKTFKRVNQPHKCWSGGTPELGFPGRKAKWILLYRALLEAVAEKAGFDCDYPPSGGAVWRRRSVFASMHGEAAGLYVNFFSDQRRTDIEAVTVVPMSANRVLHVVCLADESRIGEVAGLILHSYVVTGQVAG